MVGKLLRCPADFSNHKRNILDGVGIFSLSKFPHLRYLKYKFEPLKLKNFILIVCLYLQLLSRSNRVSFGGPGKFRITNWASCDLFTITSFSFTAVCIRRTLPSSL